MKSLSLILLTLATGAWAQSDLGPTPAPRPRLTDALRRAASATASSSDPSSGATPTPAPSPAPDSTRMAPFAVRDSRLPFYSKPKGTDPEEHAFSWSEGGTISKHVGRTFTTEIMYQYNPEIRAINLLKISW
jgi:hypothetical protein